MKDFNLNLKELKDFKNKNISDSDFHIKTIE